MNLKVRKNPELGIQVQDEILFVHENGAEIALTTACRGSFDETPYTPIKRYWTYHADLYSMKDALFVRIVEKNKVIDIVDGNWKSTTTSTQKLLQSHDGGATWFVIPFASLDGAESISHA